MLGRLTTPEPHAASDSTPDTRATLPTTTTTAFDVATITRGTPIDWSLQVRLNPNFVPIALVEHDGLPFLFAGALDRNGNTKGMQSWVMMPGNYWQSFDSIAEGYEVTDVISSPHGLIAYGSDLENGDGLVWTSADGMDWEDPIVVADGRQGQPRWFDFGVVTGDLVVIAGRTTSPETQTTFYESAQRALETHLGTDVSSFDWQEEGPERKLIFTVYGPLGIPTAIVHEAEIGIGRIELDNDPIVTEATTIWASDDGVHWVEQVTEDLQIWGGYVGADGRVRASTRDYQPDGRSTLLAIDLVDGQITVEDIGPATTEVWEVVQGGGWSLARTSGMGPGLSDNGENWRLLNLERILPSPPGSFWYAPAVGVGEGGIALVVESTLFPTVAVEPRVQWTQDGYTVSVTYGWITLGSDTGFRIIPRWQRDVGAGVAGRVDPESGALTILDPRSGVELLTFDRTRIAIIEQSLDNAVRAEQSAQHHRVFTFTTPAYWPRSAEYFDFEPSEGWIVQEIDHQIVGADITYLLVGTDRIYMATTGHFTNSALFVGPIPTERSR